jgi:carboxypeptidase PM20D1
MLGASDARHAARIAPAVYRFSPLYMSTAQRASVHGVDERVTADSLLRGVRFYRALLTAPM